MITEVFTIGFRGADEVVEIIRPLVPSPGSVSSFHNQMIVRTTSGNMVEIRQLLRSIDRAPANLLISVKNVADEEVQRDLAEVFGRARSENVAISAGRQAGRRSGATIIAGDDRSSAGVNIVRSTATRSESDVHTVRVLEGKETFIATGTAVPLRQQTTVVQEGRAVIRSGVSYARADSGFFARPRLSGDRVVLEIFPARTRLRDSAIETREAASTVSGRLGRWMEIAGVSRQTDHLQNRIGRHDSSGGTATHRVYVKVTRVTP